MCLSSDLRDGVTRITARDAAVEMRPRPVKRTRHPATLSLSSRERCQVAKSNRMTLARRDALTFATLTTCVTSGYVCATQATSCGRERASSLAVLLFRTAGLPAEPFVMPRQRGEIAPAVHVDDELIGARDGLERLEGDALLRGDDHVAVAHDFECVVL